MAMKRMCFKNMLCHLILILLPCSSLLLFSSLSTASSQFQVSISLPSFLAYYYLDKKLSSSLHHHHHRHHPKVRRKFQHNCSREPFLSTICIHSSLIYTHSISCLNFLFTFFRNMRKKKRKLLMELTSLLLVLYCVYCSFAFLYARSLNEIIQKKERKKQRQKSKMCVNGDKTKAMKRGRKRPFSRHKQLLSLHTYRF